jgi:hypothetical protein
MTVEHFIRNVYGVVSAPAVSIECSPAVVCGAFWEPAAAPSATAARPGRSSSESLPGVVESRTVDNRIEDTRVPIAASPSAPAHL